MKKWQATEECQNVSPLLALFPRAKSARASKGGEGYKMKGHTMAEEARKISDLSRMMSHDIRGSLVSISATLKLLSRGY